MEQYRPSGFQLLPPVVKNLLIINIILFLATISLANTLHIDLSDILGLHYFASQKFHFWQIITYMFMHGGFGHIFFNMFALWMFGSAIENFWGPKRFLTYYLITGIGAALLHYIIYFYQIRPVMTVINDYIANPDHDKLLAFFGSSNFQNYSQDIQESFAQFRQHYNELISSHHPQQALTLSIDFMQQYKIDFLNQPVIIGASGAVFGLLIAFGMMFPNSLIYIYFAIPVKAKYFVIAYGAIELFSGVSGHAADNVAHFAHIGGMIFGFILLKLWGVKRLN